MPRPPLPNRKVPPDPHPHAGLQQNLKKYTVRRAGASNEGVTPAEDFFSILPLPAFKKRRVGQKAAGAFARG
jgi:hypothetical protein